MNDDIRWRRWDGSTGIREFPPQPPFLDALDRSWQAVECNDDWISVGYVPCPQTLFQFAVYHYRHGRMMGFPLQDILAFCWTDFLWRRKHGR